MKKRLYYPLAILIVLHTAANAQTTPEKPSRWSLSLSAGPSFPTGKFASKDLLSDESGDARIGAGAELALTYWLNPCIGLMFAAAGQENPIGTFTSPPDPGFGTLTIENDPWKIARFLAGGTFSHPLSAGFSLDFRALAGLLKTSIPGYTYHTNSGSGLSTSQSAGKAAAFPLPWTFAYEAGAGLKWQSPGRLFLRLDAAYIGADPRLHQEITITVNGATTGTGTIAHKQPIGALLVGLGAGIRL